MSWSTYQIDDNLINEREQVGNFVPDEDRLTGLHTGMVFIIKLFLYTCYLCE